MKHPDRGHSYHRTQWNSLEKAFADAWEHENRTNGGNLLEALISRHREPDQLFAHQVTRPERYVAATAIQWLGSNIGFCFLLTCLAKCGYNIVGGQPNRDHYWPRFEDDEMLEAMAREQWYDHCDNFTGRTEAEIRQAIFDQCEPH